MCRGGRSMDMQREDVKYKQNQLKNLESQKIDYENKKQDIDWQIQELKEKKRKQKKKQINSGTIQTNLKCSGMVKCINR